MSDPTTTYQDIERIWLTADGGIKAALRAMAGYFDGQRRPVEVTDAAVDALAEELSDIYYTDSENTVDGITAIARHVLTTRQPKPENVERIMSAIVDVRSDGLVRNGALAFDEAVARAVVALYDPPPKSASTPTFESLRQLFWDRGIHGEKGDDLAREVVRMCEAHQANGSDAAETLGERADLTTELDVANDRIRVLEAERDKWKSQAFSPIGDNHHNALLCPHCNPDGSDLAITKERNPPKWMFYHEGVYEEATEEEIRNFTRTLGTYSDEKGMAFVAMQQMWSEIDRLRAQLNDIAQSPAIRLGEGLTEAQEAMSAGSKLSDADRMFEASKAIRDRCHWFKTHEGSDSWRSISDRLSDMAIALRASATPKPDPVDWVQKAKSHMEGVRPSAGAVVIMAGLCEQIEALQAKVV